MSSRHLVDCSPNRRYEIIFGGHVSYSNTVCLTHANAYRPVDVGATYEGEPHWKLANYLNIVFFSHIQLWKKYP